MLLLQTTSPLLFFGKNEALVDQFCGSNCKTTLVDFDNDLDLFFEHDTLVPPPNDRAEALFKSLKWINVQAVLLDICIAFHPLDLPPYVILEIVDKFPFWETHVNRKKKIDYIIQIKRFCDALIDDRSRSKRENKNSLSLI
jgi:hypothetical protein